MTATHFQPRSAACSQAATRHRTALDDLSDAAQSVVATLRAWRRRMRERDQLSRMDDRMLADIGLTRGDVRDAVSEPVWRDPTAILVSRAQERRVNRRTLVRPSEAPSIVPGQKERTFEAPVQARYY